MPIDLGVVALVAVVGIALFLFGGPKVLSWAKNLGQAHRVYKDALAGKDDSAPKGN